MTIRFDKNQPAYGWNNIMASCALIFYTIKINSDPRCEQLVFYVLYIYIAKRTPVNCCRTLNVSYLRFHDCTASAMCHAP